MDGASLRDDEVDVLFEPLRHYRALLLAVSGGADSTALMYLAAGWRLRLDGAAPRLIVVTVDHDLRENSAVEAAAVARQAATLLLDHRTLRWGGSKPSVGLQAAARDARYDLLTAVAAEAHAEHGDVVIVTAHTADDQAETLLMRLARGSGVDGLAGIPARGRREFDRGGPAPTSIPLHRPLLTVSRARLVATLQAANIPFIEDPSNRDRRFERVRVREALSVLEGLGVSRSALSRTAGRMQLAKAALDDAVSQLASRAVRDVLGVVHLIDFGMLVLAPEETGMRLLRGVLAKAGGCARAAELSAVEDAYRRLRSLALSPRREMTLTLGGCIVELVGSASDAHARDAKWASKGVIKIYREPDRDGGLPHLTLSPGEGAIWDRRVWGDVAATYPGSVDFGPLGREWGRLAAQFPSLGSLGLPMAAGRGLPAFQKSGTILAVPILAEAARSLGDEAAAVILDGPLQCRDGQKGPRPMFSSSVLPGPTAHPVGDAEDLEP